MADTYKLSLSSVASRVKYGCDLMLMLGPDLLDKASPRACASGLLLLLLLLLALLLMALEALGKWLRLQLWVGLQLWRWLALGWAGCM